MPPYLAPANNLVEDSIPVSRHWDFAKWINVEVGGETRKLSGFTARGYVGLAFLLNRSDGTPERRQQNDTVVPVVTTMAYIGAAFGAAFGSSGGG